MKRIDFMGIRYIKRILGMLCLALGFLFTACEGDGQNRPASGESPRENAGSENGSGARDGANGNVSVSERPTGESIYQLESRWATQRGDTIKLNDLAGKPRLVAMVYTHCEYACPMILQNFRNIDRELPSQLRSKVGKVLVTFDPDRDTPERLKAYAEKKGLDPGEWTLLQGHSGDILELAMLLGVKYKKTPGGEFSHSNSITLLNDKGEIAYRSQGLKSPARDMVKQVKSLF